jgi:hypothetical protein
VDGQNSANFPTKIDFAALDPRPEHRALAHFDNCSGHPQTVGMYKSPDVDTVTHIQLSHPKIIPWLNSQGKTFF